MLKTVFFSLVLLGFSFSIATAQAPLQTELDKINTQRLKLNKRGMIVLGSWAVANIGISGAMMPGSEGSTRSFHQMNIAWNAVNLGIAGLGYWGSHRAMKKNYDLTNSVKEQNKIQLSLMVNTGLDVGYMALGLYLRERSFNPAIEDSDRFLGWGNSLILQGGFLFAYDIIMQAVHARHGNRGIMKVLDRVQPSPTGIGLSINLD